ncbi:MAG: SprT family zinc-dependent metalloprotease [Proteobacteria bacterium]|nr:SprT family zinc-dependent metalloprotease [Pseudomonadota bacterium]
MTGSYQYGAELIQYDVLYLPRKTMEIAVYPDLKVVIRSPLHVSQEEIKQKIKKRAKWITKQIRYFRQFDPRTPARSYISGETHLYLGRQYRLKIIAGKESSVKLYRGKIVVLLEGTSQKKQVKEYLDSWYVEKAREKFKQSLERCMPKLSKMKFKQPLLHIRAMRSRWGSLSKNGTLTLNPVLIRAPKECIDYVITHELCHMKYHDHSKQFYELLDNVMPDWEKRKHRLELALM